MYVYIYIYLYSLQVKHDSAHFIRHRDTTTCYRQVGTDQTLRVQLLRARSESNLAVDLLKLKMNG